MKGLYGKTNLSVAILLPLLLCPLGISGGKVLVFPMDGSHWVNMKVLVEELHARGHNITVIVPSDSWYINKTSSYYNSVVIPMSDKLNERIDSFLPRFLQNSREAASLWTQIKMQWEFLDIISELHFQTCDMITEMFENNRLMQSLQDSKYDLVLTDPAFGGGMLLAHRLGLPLVFNVRWSIQGEGHFAIAPSPLSYVPFPGAELTDNMSFLERVRNIFAYLFGMFQFAVMVNPHYTRICQRYFSPDTDILTLTQGADIWLMRNDFVFEFPRPTMPNVVYMGGFQCKPPKPLPPDLEEFVASSGEHGVIIMSLGTLFHELSEKLTDEIAAAFAELPQKVIWRHIGRKPASLGNNTLLVKWMPQNDLLGNPKTRVFVAHGGTNGVQEAIYHGVPIVGLPLVFDQPDNLSRMKAKGVAKIVDFTTMDRNTFLQAIQEVLHDPSYRMKMQHLSRLHRDQPMKPLDRAMFWIEFVMRHKGAAHLRTESYKMPWYAYHSVDVMVVLFAFVSLGILCTTVIVRFLCYKIGWRKK